MSLEFELVLPCYNEEKSLWGIISRTAESAMRSGFSEKQFQLVIVENGSLDQSLSVLAEIQKSELAKWFRVVRVSQNQGYGYGIMSGLKTTTAPIIGWSHSDLQCDPMDAFRAIALSKNALVKGSRSGRSFKEVFVSRVFDLVSSIVLGFPAYEINAQPKIFPRKLLEAMKNPPRDFALDLYLLFTARKNKVTTLTIPVIFAPRVNGLSSWAFSLKNRYRTILKMIQYCFKLRKEESSLWFKKN